MTSIDAPTREGATITPETGNNGNTVFNFEAPVSPLATQPDLDLAKEISQSAPSDAHSAFTEVATDVQPKYSTEEIGKGSASPLVDNSSEFDAASAESLAANGQPSEGAPFTADTLTSAGMDALLPKGEAPGSPKVFEGTSARPPSSETNETIDPDAVAAITEADSIVQEAQNGTRRTDEKSAINDSIESNEPLVEDDENVAQIPPVLAGGAEVPPAVPPTAEAAPTPEEEPEPAATVPPEVPPTEPPTADGTPPPDEGSEPSSDPGTQRRNELSRKHLAEGLNADEQKEFDNFLNGTYENGVLTPRSDEIQPEGRTTEELAADSARIDQEMRDAALQGKAVLESAPDQGPMSERPTDALLASNPDTMNLDELQSHVDELSQRFSRDELSDAETDALDQYEEVLKTRKDEVDANQQTESVTTTTESSEDQKKKEEELQRLKGKITDGSANTKDIEDYQRLLKEESPETRKKNLTEAALRGELKPEEVKELAKLNGEAPAERTAEQVDKENIDAYASILKDLGEGKGFDENGNMTQEMKDKVDNFRKLQVEQSNINAGVDPKDARILAEKALESMSKRKEKELAITKEIRQKLAELTAAEMRLAAVPQLLEQARRRKKETMAQILTKEPDVGKGTDEERMQKRTELNSLYMRAAGSKEEIVKLKNSATDLTLQYKENMAYVRRKLGLAGPLETFFKVMDAKVYGMVADTRLNYASLYDNE